MSFTDRDQTYLLGIQFQARLALRYTEGFDQDRFRGDDFAKSIVGNALIHVGNLVNVLSPEFKKAHPAVPWRRIIGMRNILAHDYYAIDFDLVWIALTEGVPALLREIEPLLPTPP